MENPKSYKKIEKWWLTLIVIFYALYNLPGVPGYHNPYGTILHGALTVIPLWIISYAGMIILHKKRTLKVPDSVQPVERKEDVKC